MKEPLNRFPRMSQEYLVRRLRDMYRANHRRVMGLQTAQEAIAYRGEVREKLQRVFGPWPERAPLNIRVTNERRRDAYTIRSVIFDSLPGFPVTANVYLPPGRGESRPGVLCLCGHRWDAKAYQPYQWFAQNLARMGCVSLIFDPVGQGERLQYPDGHGESLYGPGPSYPSVREHNAMDRQLSLVGDWVGKWFVWDGMRALDVLLEQEDVDPSRIGVTGNSGGGTMSAYAFACDTRITMAAPSCWVTSWYHNGINEEPLDAEQCPPEVLAMGLEQSDLFIARAPVPVILLTQEQDFFDQRGALDAYKRLRHVYRLLGSEEHAAYHVGPGGHNYWKDAREAMYAFFSRHAGLDADSVEPELAEETETALRCTPTGQASDLPGARCVPDFVGDAAAILSQRRDRLSEPALAAKLTQLLRLPRRAGPPDYRVLRPWTDRGYARPYASHFVLETDLDYGTQVVVTKLEDQQRVARPQQGRGSAVLYLPHLSSDRELREDAALRDLQKRNSVFFACDYRGIGESRPDTCRPDSFLGMYGSDFHYASYASMMGEPYIGLRVHDVLSTIDWIAAFGYDQLHLVAKGWGSIIGAFAALLEARVDRVTLFHPLRSYSALAETTIQEWPFSAMLPGVLSDFDLPDVYRALERKSIELIEPWGPEMS